VIPPNTWSQIHHQTDGRRNNDQEAGDKHMSLGTCSAKMLPAVPCHVGDPDLWFAESPVDLERAKALCADCPIRRECLSAALERQEPWGVWGGEILDRGTIVARKRPRGRPRKHTEVAHARSTKGDSPAAA
jgi:WhiB family transcriptional regulator, redox-sensing transcriptional regulator